MTCIGLNCDITLLELPTFAEPRARQEGESGEPRISSYKISTDVLTHNKGCFCE